MPLWDNARFLAVTLVVIGHGIQRLTADSDPALIVYLLVYSFHIPAFAIISGYFSRAGEPTTRRMLKVITDFFLPYIIMESIWSLVKFLAEGEARFDPARPSWTLWFLLALGVFRVILPYLALLRWPFITSLIASVGVGYLDSVTSTFSLSRTIGILPFFVLGYSMRQWRAIDRWRNASSLWAVRLAAVAVFTAWLVVLIVFIDVWRSVDLRFWFFYDDSYRGLGEDQWFAGLIRLAIIALAVLLCAAFLVLVPRRSSRMTALGAGTMYVYLLHSFVLYPLRQSGVLQIGYPSLGLLAIMILISIGIAIVLASRPIRRFFRPLIEPRPAWLFSERVAGELSLPTVSRRIDSHEPRS